MLPEVQQLQHGFDADNNDLGLFTRA